MTKTAQNIMTVQLALHAFHSQCSRLTDFLDHLPVNGLYREVAPGRNTGLYIVGHLIASNESMLTLFGLGEKLYPGFMEAFVEYADKTVEHAYSEDDIIRFWKKHEAHMKEKLALLLPENWLDKHNGVTAEDFRQQPYRNKLNVLINRTTHMSYHLGQLRLLQP